MSAPEAERIAMLGIRAHDGESSHADHDCVLSCTFNSYLILYLNNSYLVLCHTHKCTQ